MNADGEATQLVTEPDSTRDGPGSVTVDLRKAVNGDPEVWGPIWGRYFDRLTRLAHGMMARGGRSRTVSDAEDVAAAALESVWRGIARGRFAKLDDRSDLWRLLATIAFRKTWRIPLAGPPAIEDPELVRDADPTPEMAAIFAEEVTRLLNLLEDEELRRVALWRLEGFSVQEIANKLGLGQTTSAAKWRIKKIRELWEKDQSE